MYSTFGTNWATSQGFVQQGITQKEVSDYRIVAFGVNNTYPQQATYVLSRCGVAQASLAVLAEFLEGDGFKDELFANTIINSKNENANALLSQTVECLAKNRAFFWHVSYTLDLNTGLPAPYDVRLVEYDNVRFSIPVDGKYCSVKIWDNWANSSPKIAPSSADMVEVDLWGAYSDEEVLQRIEACGGLENYHGQIVWFSLDGKINTPSAIDGAWDDSLTVGNLSEFGNNYVNNGFSASTVIVDEGGNYADESVRQANEAQIQKLGGVQTAGGIALLYGNLRNLEVASKQLDKDYDIISERAESRIKYTLGVPQILVNGSREGNGFANKEELQNAFEFFNGKTRKTRNKLAQEFKKVFSKFTYPVNPSQDYSIKPQTFGVS